MKKQMLMTALVVIASICLYQQVVRAQAEPEKSKATRFEVGAQFSSVTFSPDHTQPGAGARFTFNFNDNFALEAETNYYPNDNGVTSFERVNGRLTEGLFGVKAGKRFKNFGIFGKARPGFMSFSRGIGDVVITGPAPAGSAFPLFEFRPRRLTHFALDLGGVLEFYPSRRIVTRFDAGVTIIRKGETSFQGFSAGPAPDFAPIVGPVRIPGENVGSFRFSAGIGYRF